MKRFFICGSALTGQPDHGNLGGARLLGAVSTQPKYRLHSVGGRHPGIYEAESGGISIPGELYELTDEQYAFLMAGEPPDLYEADVDLADGTTASAMLYPRDLIERNNYDDISQHGGWVNYKASQSR